MKKLLFITTILVVFASCNKWVAPPFTNVSELSKVRKGMTMTKVNEVLGIQPYDIYTVQDDGGTVLVYNYRVKERRMNIGARWNYNQRTKTERGQKEGIDWYGEASRVYILFEDDKVASLITDHGREDAEILMVTSNNLQLISKDDLVSLKYSGREVLVMGDDGTVTAVNLPDGQNNSKSVLFTLSKENKKGVFKSKIEEDEKKKGIIKYAVLGVAAIAVLIILLTSG
ncbi:MAG TPA: hypothetical protein DCX54_04345 [Flavobacteriales bacterium]|nr:hypothetical protein [Flavobacteriales bacterium]